MDYDIHYDKVVLLLPFTTASGLADFSPNPKTITNSSVSIITTYHVEGSAYFNGSGFLSTPASNDFILSGDFTIEGWEITTSLSHKYGCILSTATTSGTNNYNVVIQYNSATEIPVRNRNMLGFYGNSFSTSSNLPISNEITVGNNNHFAIGRQNGTIYFRHNGVVTSTLSYSGSINMAYLGLFIGKNLVSGTDGYFTGALNHLRITNGVWRYPDDFIPTFEDFPTRLPRCVLSCPSAKFTDGSIATKAAAFLSGTKALVGEATPDPITGEFSIIVPNQDSANFDVAIYRDGYRPLIHGPISATAS